MLAKFRNEEIVEWATNKAWNLKGSGLFTLFKSSKIIVPVAHLWHKSFSEAVRLCQLFA